MNTRQLSSRLSATVVAGIAAVASYTHMRALALHYGQEPLIGTLLPLSVDGLVIVAAVAIGDGRAHRWSAWLSFWIGISASVVANVLAARPDPIARAISAWPAVALLLVVEVISRSGRRTQPDEATTDAAESAPPAATPRVRQPSRQGAANRSAKDSAEDAANATAQKQTTKAAAKVARAAARKPDATAAELARLAGVSVRSVERYRPAKPAATNRANGARTAAASTPPTITVRRLTDDDGNPIVDSQPVPAVTG